MQIWLLPSYRCAVLPLGGHFSPTVHREKVRLQTYLSKQAKKRIRLLPHSSCSSSTMLMASLPWWTTKYPTARQWEPLLARLLACLAGHAA